MDEAGRYRRRRHLLFALGAALALAACGKKGELDLPPEPLSEPVPEAVTPVPDSPDQPTPSGGDGG